MKNYVINIKALKQALNPGLILQKVHRVIEFKEKGKNFVESLHRHEYRNQNLKFDFEKDFFRLMNNFKFWKTAENVKKQKDIKLVTTIERRHKFVSRPNHQTKKCFSENLLAIELHKTEVKMEKPIYLGLSVLDMIK